MYKPQQTFVVPSSFRKGGIVDWHHLTIGKERERERAKCREKFDRLVVVDKSLRLQARTGRRIHFSFFRFKQEKER